MPTKLKGVLDRSPDAYQLSFISVVCSSQTPKSQNREISLKQLLCPRKRSNHLDICSYFRAFSCCYIQGRPVVTNCKRGMKEIESAKWTYPRGVIKALMLTMVAFCGESLCGARQTIDFDDINPGAPPGVSIPNGYAGLQWNNFYVLNATDPVYNPSGYLSGLLSGHNVAYNGFGDPALFSSTGTFDLNSAYLTGAWNDGLSIEVKGFIGATLAYDNTYIVNATAPSFITFDYLGVTSVEFISSGGIHHQGYAGSGTHFAMDNLTITVPEPSTVLLLACAGMPLLLRRCRVRRAAEPQSKGEGVLTRGR